MPSKFLVAVDGSEPSQRAVAHAIKLAKEPSGSSLHLLNVMPELGASKEKKAERESKQAKSFLDPAVKMVQVAGVTHTAEVVQGGLARQIVKRADQLNCDGIIMGTHGMGAIGNVLMGSVATEVVHQTKLPVTLVK